MLIASHKIQIHTEGANIFPSGGLSLLSPHPSEVCSEECSSKFPIPVTMFVKHSQVPALLNTPWFFQYIPSLDGSLSLIWVSACFRSSFLKFSMPFICCSIFFSIWIAAITRAFTLQDLVFLYLWILIFWLDV